MEVRKKDIIIKNKILQDLMIFADRNMLETILRNLVSNALKSTKFGGEITINALSIVESLTLNIKDDGDGMEKQELDNLFNLETPFTSFGIENEKGTGLGLVICREFANRHGGKIWAETRKNEGSTFYVLFPHGSH
jgi:signal transduction histidine kinase